MPVCILLRNRKKGYDIEETSKQPRETMVKNGCIYSYVISPS